MKNIEKSVLTQSKPWGLQWALLFQLLAMLAFMVPPAIVKNVYFVYYGFDPKWLSPLNFAVALAMIVFTLFTAKELKALTWKGSFQFLGFKKTSFRQILIGLLVLVPILFFSFYRFWSHQDLFWEAVPAQRILILILCAVFEELYFRGFLFQLLRKGRSFIGAATLSGLFWATTHLGLLSSGSRLDAVDVALTMLTAFLFSFSLALLFEKSGYVIWACLVAHAGYDLILEFFVANPNAPFTENFNLARVCGFIVVILTGFLTWGLTVWLLPRLTEEPVSSGAKTNLKIPQENQVSAQWAPWIIVFILAVTGFLVFGNNDKKADEKNVIDYYQQIVDKTPDQPTAHLKLGLALEAYNHPDPAEVEFSKTIQLDPGNYMAYVSWSECLNGRKDYKHAIPLIQKALQINPNYADAYLDWGYALEGLEKSDEALPMFEKALELNPNATVLKRANVEIGEIKSNSH